MADRVGMTFSDALWEAIRKSPRRIRLIDRWRVRIALRRHDMAQEVECEAVEMGLACGVIKPGQVNPATGTLVGEWGDGQLFQLIIDNLPAILEFIAGLISIFALL